MADQLSCEMKVVLWTSEEESYESVEGKVGCFRLLFHYVSTLY